MPHRSVPIGFVVDEALNITEFVGRTAPLVQLSAGTATLHLPSLIQPRFRPRVLDALREARSSQLPAVRDGFTVYDEDQVFSASVRVAFVPDSEPFAWRVLFDLTPVESVALTSQNSAPGGNAASARAERRLHFENLLRDQDKNYETALEELREAAHSRETMAVELEMTNEELRVTNAALLAAHQEVIEANVSLVESRAALQERLQFISGVFDTVGALIVVVDPAGIIQEFNRACERITGLSAKEACGMSVFALIPPEERESVYRVREELLAGAVSVAHTNDWINRNGERRRISWLNTKILGEDGTPAYAISTGIDISEQVRVERALAASEAKFRALIETAGESILCVDGASRIVIANPAAETLFGYEPGQLIGQPLNLLVPERYHLKHGAEHAAYFQAPKVLRMAASLNIVGRRRDGTEVPLDISLSHFETDQGRLAVAFVQDVTERLTNRRRLQLLARSLMTAQDAERVRIARDLHDDLTQSIAVIGMKIGFVKQSLDKPREAILAELDAAARSVDQLAEEVRELSHRLHPSVLEYSGLIPALEALVADAQNHHGLLVRLAVERSPEEIPTHVASTLYRVAQEALRNARKHAQAKSVLLKISSGDGMIRMTILDDGRGFDPAQRRVGPGLGLVSMEERVSDVHGRFTVRSSPGKGTAIEVIVPLAQTTAASASSSGSSAIR